VLSTDRDLSGLAPVIPFSKSKSMGYAKKATASSSVGQFYHDPAAAFDDNPRTVWKIGRRKDVDFNQYYGKNIHYLSEEVMSLYEPSGWLEIDLGAPATVGKIKLGETKSSNSEIKKFEVQYQSAGKWVKLAEDTRMGTWEKTVTPVKAQKFRLAIQEYHGYFGINEFQLFPPDK